MDANCVTKSLISTLSISVRIFRLKLSEANMDFIKQIKYCPPNETIFDIWINHGIPHCFLDTVASSTIAAFILIFGTFQLLMYRRYAIPTNTPARSKLYCLQISLIFIVAILSCTRFICESFVFDDSKVYGYTVSRLYFVFDHRVNWRSLIDTSDGTDVLLDVVLNRSNTKRTKLPVALDPDARTRSHLADILGAHVHQ